LVPILDHINSVDTTPSVSKILPNVIYSRFILPSGIFLYSFLTSIFPFFLIRASYPAHLLLLEFIVLMLDEERERDELLIMHLSPHSLRSIRLRPIFSSTFCSQTPSLYVPPAKLCNAQLKPGTPVSSRTTSPSSVSIILHQF
jgi:hypothetical protein